MSKIEQLESFIKIVECDGLIRAAEALHLTPPALTKQMKVLEGNLGVSLFHRVGRRLILTEIGQQYYEEAVRVLQNLTQLERLIKTGKKEVSGILKIRSTQHFGHAHLFPRLREFLERYPALRVNIELLEYAPNFIKDKVDIIYGVAMPGQDNWVQKKIGMTSYALCASSIYLQRFGTPQKIADLYVHRYLTHTGRYSERLVHFKGQDIMLPPYLWFNNYDGLLAAGLEGLGLIWVHRYAVEDYLKKGQLIEILAEEAAPPRPVYLQYLAAEYIDPKVRAFVDFFG